MQSVNIHEAKTRFSKLLEEVQKGEEIIIAKAGHPIAKLTSYTPARRKVAPPGSMEGEAWCADDFDESLATLFATRRSVLCQTQGDANPART